MMPFLLRPLRRVIVCLGLLAGACLGTRADTWPQVESDLPAHAGVHTGTLPNGLRYAVMTNPEPQGRVSLRLLVHAGSVQERDDERGLAHFVEHMAFRGTRSHPGDELTEVMQRRGIGFGPDSTAFTSYEHTIYHLELPDTTAGTLRFGLGVLREYASEVSFDPATIERERGVVLTEKRTRDTPDARIGQANLAFLFPDSRQVARMPIGLEEQIRHFTRDQFVAFYDAWYRPDRLAVIVVGDLAVDAAVRLITETFAGLAPRGAPRETPPLVPAQAARPNVVVFPDAGINGAACWLEHPFPEARSPDTHARRVAALHRALAFAMFQRRMTRLADRGSGAFVGPFANVQPLVPDWQVASFGVSGAITDWRSLIESLEQEHRRAFVYGFTAGELRLARESFASAYDTAVRTSLTWPSSWIANRIAETMIAGTVFASPAIERADLAADLAATTTEDCLQAFRTTWTKHSAHVFIATNPAFAVDPITIGTALNLSRGKPVERPADLADVVFAYTDFGPPGPIIRETHAADLAIHQAEFANHVRLNFKPTPFETDTVNLAVRVGDGRRSQPRDQPGLDLLAQTLVLRGGVGRHTWTEFGDLLGRHSVALDFFIEDDALVFTGRCPRDQVEFCLQAIAACITDTSLRETAMNEVKGALGTMYGSLAASPGGPITMMARRILSGGDRRYGVARSDEIEHRTPAELRAWLGPQLQHGPIELGLVGDTTWEAVAPAVARTLGALAPRQLPDPTPETLAVVEKPDRPVYVYTTAPQLQQVALAWFCPVADLPGTHAERRCHLLSALVEDRLRLRLRTELGAAYGCTVNFWREDALPHFAYFEVYTEVSSAHARRANDLIRSTLEDFWKHPVSADEFTRALAPFVSQREADRRDNRYWLYTVLHDAQQRTNRLVDARDRVADSAAITRHDVEALAHRYFSTKRWFQFVAYPQR